MKLISSTLLLALATSSAMADIPAPPRPYPNPRPAPGPVYGNTIYDAAAKLELAISDASAYIGGNRRVGQTMRDTLRTALSVATELRLVTSQAAPDYTQMSVAVEQIDTYYMTIARMLHSSGMQLGPRQLDAWYGVAKAIGGMRVALEIGNIPTQPDYPIPGTMNGYEFTGQIEGQPVFASGNTPAEFMQSCQQTMASARISSMDEMTMDDGRKASATYGYWDAKSACGLMLLNARVSSYSGRRPVPGYPVPSTPVPGDEQYVIGSIESMSIRIPMNLTIPAIRELVEAAIPNGSAIARTVDEFSMNKIRSTANSGYFSAEALRMMVVYNVPSLYPSSLSKVGKIGNVSFTFSGYTRQDIQNQCLEFYKGVNPRSVDQVTVNGKSYPSRGSYYNADSACLAIAAAQ